MRKISDCFAQLMVADQNFENEGRETRSSFFGKEIKLSHLKSQTIICQVQLLSGTGPDPFLQSAGDLG